MQHTFHLIVTCPDQPGIVSKISAFLYHRQANIVELDQYSTDPTGGTFFLRLAFDIDAQDHSILKNEFEQEIATPLKMQWDLNDANRKKRMAILVSKHEHALLELLWHWQTGELNADISFVISNHTDIAPIVDQYGLFFQHIPVDKNNKKVSEKNILNLIKNQADFVVLARYMQILSDDFIAHFPNKIINIHHSFLPAFVGADPYQQAYDRGVKIIGATAHFVTPELDAGPIIEQDIMHISHKQHRNELRRLGRDIERRVLLKAVRWFLEDRIIVHGNKTVIF